MYSETMHAALHSPEQMRQFHERGLWGDKLLVDYLDLRATLTPDKPAIVERDSTASYRELVQASKNIAAALHALGIEKGDSIAILAPNWAELPTVHFAANRIGAIVVPLSVGFRAKELEHLLKTSRARLLFCPTSFRGLRYVDMAESLRPSLPDLERIIALRDPACPEPHAPDAAGFADFNAMANYVSWQRNGDAWLPSLRPHPDAPSFVAVSSGTTGLPRCSLYSDNNIIVKCLQQYVEVARVSDQDVAIALAPAGTGATGYVYPILTMLLLGATSILLEHWNASDLDQVFELIEEHECTVAVAVPAQLVRLAQAAGANRRRIDTIRVVTTAGAKLPPSVADAVEAMFDCKIQSIYGTTEAGATAMTRVDDPDAKRRATVGRPLASQEVLILDDAGIEVAPGAVGEVCWRGANKSYGFLNDPEGTRRAWDSEGLLHSGDLGRIDEEGYLHVVGRKKDMIIRGGQNINPSLIEEALLHHPDVSEIAIVAFEDAVLGERVAACVVARNGAQLTLESLKSVILEKGLAAWNQPELLVLMNELPRNAGGKIDKLALARVTTEASMSPKRDMTLS